MPNRRLGFYKLPTKKKSLKAFVALLGIIAAFPASAQQEPSSVRPYQPRVETNIRAGTERTILMTEAWVPLAQDNGRIVYGDVRLMGDDGDNREWNFGIGYREMNAQADAAFGLHGWFDRRRSSRGSVFHQFAGGVEYFSEGLDIRLNGYIPLKEVERYTIAAASTAPYLSDTGIYYDTNGQLVEKPLHGFDLEFSVPVRSLEGAFDSFRVSAGGFVFDGSNVESLRGVRLRAAADVTPDLQIGARFETDNQRGAQAFAEATLRFPFGSKASNRTLGLRSRLDESPERDIDVITSSKVAVAATQRNAVTSSFDGLEQRVFHVDNTATAGGDGSLSNPFNTLAAANAAANRPGDVIYLNRGDGTTAGQNQGVTLAHQGQALIGSGVDFVYDGTRFTAGSSTDFSGTILRAASTAPVISNTGGNGVSISADNIRVTGLDILGTAGDGIFTQNVSDVNISNVNISLSGNRGIFVGATNYNPSRDIQITNVQILNSQSHGISFDAVDGSFGAIHLESVHSERNGQSGFDFSFNRSTADMISLSNLSAQDNDYIGAAISTVSDSSINVVNISDSDFLGSGSEGLFISAIFNSFIDELNITDTSITGNSDGATIAALLTGSYINQTNIQRLTSEQNIGTGLNLLSLGNSQLNLVSIDNSSISFNGSEGLFASTRSNTSLGVGIENTDFIGNGGVGIYLERDGGILTADLGGGSYASSGNNSIYNNNDEINLDIPGYVLFARHNWWNSPSGFNPMSSQVDPTSSIDASNWLVSAPIR